MFNPDLKKILKGCNSRYSLVAGVAKRAREIRDEANNNDVLLDEKCVSMAINEIYDGKYVVEEPEEIKSRSEEEEKETSNNFEAAAEEESSGDTESAEK